MQPPEESESESTAIERAVAIVAYAELRGVMVAWAGVRTWEPVTHAWAALRRALNDGMPPRSRELVEHAQVLLRDESRLALEPAMRRAGPWPFDRTIAPGQIGSLEGIEAVFHDAARVAVVHRAIDPRLLSVAIKMADFVDRYREGSSPA